MLVLVLIGVLFEVLMAARAHLVKIDGRVLGGMQFGALAQVLFWGVTVRGGGGLGLRLGCWLIFARLTAGCVGGCCLGCSSG